MIAVMECAHYDAGRCRSCTLLPLSSHVRVRRSQAEIARLLAQATAASGAVSADCPVPESAIASGTPPTSTSGGATGIRWLPPATGPDAGFRNKAKMVVSGTVDAPVFGILDDAGAGIDLRDCPLYPQAIHRLLDAVPALIRRAQIPPYDVARRRGELKHLIITVNDAGELMVRFVLRTPKPVERIREHLSVLTAAVPGVRVVSANIHPQHTALLEGAEEIHIAGDRHLPMRQGRVSLQVLPRSFVQTNTAVAGQLYEQVAEWADEIEARRRLGTGDSGPGGTGAADTGSPGAGACDGAGDSALRIWDLYCGVGGFALHLAAPGRAVTGVEVSAEAIASAQAAAAEAGLTADFIVADASDWAGEQDVLPDVVVVNPPRRGIGALAGWLEDSGIGDVIYSSCNPRSLARDLTQMPSYQVTAARMLDMFPHTAHAEVVVHLRRSTEAA